MLAAQTIETRHSDIFTFLHGDLGSGASHCHIPAEALLNEIRKKLNRVMKHLHLLDSAQADSPDT